MTKATKKVKCHICDKEIVQSKLKRHVRFVHEGIKNHCCKICDQKFGESGTLKTHVKTVHEGIKDHHCQFCNKKFGRPGHLKSHVKEVHEGIKEHQCQI